MTAFLNIERSDDGWVDRYRAYEVIVNGQKRADLRRGEQRTIEVGSGQIVVVVKIDWCSSHPLTIAEPEAGSELRIHCRPSNLMAALYSMVFARDNYIRLEMG